jgi:hypothetical protein
MIIFFEEEKHKDGFAEKENREWDVKKSIY